VDFGISRLKLDTGTHIYLCILTVLGGPSFATLHCIYLFINKFGNIWDLLLYVYYIC